MFYKDTSPEIEAKSCTLYSYTVRNYLGSAHPCVPKLTIREEARPRLFSYCSTKLGANLFQHQQSLPKNVVLKNLPAFWESISSLSQQFFLFACAGCSSFPGGQFGLHDFFPGPRFSDFLHAEKFRFLNSEKSEIFSPSIFPMRKLELWEKSIFRK